MALKVNVSNMVKKPNKDSRYASEKMSNMIRK
jgi:hypothetical protein